MKTWQCLSFSVFFSILISKAEVNGETNFVNVTIFQLFDEKIPGKKSSYQQSTVCCHMGDDWQFYFQWFAYSQWPTCLRIGSKNVCELHRFFTYSDIFAFVALFCVDRTHAMRESGLACCFYALKQSHRNHKNSTKNGRPCSWNLMIFSTLKSFRTTTNNPLKLLWCTGWSAIGSCSFVVLWPAANWQRGFRKRLIFITGYPMEAGAESESNLLIKQLLQPWKRHCYGSRIRIK